jgi:ATP-dependent helicase HepA
MFDEIQSSDQVDLYERAIRFGYRVPGHGGEVSLIPISTFMDDFLGALDYDYRLSTARQPLTFPHLSRRQAAVKSSTRIIRYGDDFIEALNQFTDFDDRGRSYAMWRHIHVDSPTNQGMFFRFDFLIETEIKYAKVVLKNSETTNTNTGISAVLRRGDALYAPRVIQIWVDEDGHKVSQYFIEKYLNKPYDKHSKNGDYTDKNLKSLRFISLMRNQPDFFINWYERCVNNRNKANDYLLDDQYFEQEKITAIDLARKDDEIRFAQLETRIQALEGIQAEYELKQLQFEKELNEALYKGIARPSIRVDVAGVVILANGPYEREFI